MPIRTSTARWLFMAAICAAAWLIPQDSRAETGQVTIAEQYGIAYLPLTVMRDQHLLEQRLKQAGLSPTINWNVFSGSSPMTDAVLSGSLDFASGAFANFIIVWNKTHGAVRAVAPLPATPLYLLTIDPKVHTLSDLGPGSHIALPTVGVSTQAFLLQYAAAKMFGVENYKNFDFLTVSMGHPDAVNMLFTGRTEVNSHFSSPPFQAAELRNPAVHKIASSYDILGGIHTSSVVWAPVKFHDENPKTYMAFLLAYRDASELIQRDPRRAAEAYLRQIKSKETLEALTAQVADPEFDYGLIPMQLDKITGLMFDTKRLATRPDIIKDLFFPELQQVTAK